MDRQAGLRRTVSVNNLAPVLARVQMSYGRFRIPVFVALLMVALCARAQEPPQPAHCRSDSVGFMLRLHLMPDLKGCSAQKIDKILRDKKRQPQLVPKVSSAPADQIVDQRPPAGSKLSKEDPIILYVSKGTAAPAGAVIAEIPKTVPQPKPSADLTVSNTLSTATLFHVGEQIEFTLVVANQGPDTATGVRLLLQPQNLRILGPSSCVESGCGIGDLPHGGSSTQRVTAQIMAQGRFSLTGIARASEYDPHSKNNGHTVAGYAEPSPIVDLAVQGSLQPDPPYREGDEVSMNVTVSNRGPATATQVRISNSLQNLEDPHISYFSRELQSGIDDGACDVAECTIPSLAANTSIGFTLEARIAHAGEFVAATSIDSSQPPDHGKGPHRASIHRTAIGTPPPSASTPPPPSASTTPPPPPTVDLAVQSVLQPGPPYREGDKLSVNVVVQNRGPAMATEVRITNALSNLRSVKQANAACVAGCIVPRLAANKSIEFTIRAQIEQAGEFSAITSVTSSQVDSGPGPLSGTSEGEAEPAWWPWPPSLITIAVAVALGLLGAGGAFHLTRKAWWRKRIHVRVQLDASDRTASVESLHLTEPAVGIRISVLPGQSMIGRLPIEREETSHE